MKGIALGFRVSPLGRDGANGPVGAAADGREIGNSDGSLADPPEAAGAIFGFIVAAARGSCIPAGFGAEDGR